MNHHERPDRDASELDALTAWLSASCSPVEQATLRERIAIHEERLHNVPLAERAEAVVDALLHDATTNPTLAAALHCLQRTVFERRQDRAELN